ncbi:MAG TPA: alpha/beta hydrolase, partial [Actinomycetota bacterium]|nr:alpha/beta hydrolase [Actinomycetota bacterium]
VLTCTSADPEMGNDSIYHPEHPDHGSIMEAYADGRTRDAFAMIAHRPHLIPERRSTFSEPHQAAFDEEFPTLRVAERLGEISIPALVIVGRHDRAIPPAYGRLLAEGIAGAQLVEFEESGHFPSLEEPDRFRATVADFCNGAVM